MKFVWIYGKHASEAALRNENRIIYEARCITEQTKNLVKQIRPEMRVNMVDERNLNRTTKGGLHQGIALCCEATQVEKKLPQELEHGRILVLDHLQDVGNIGSIMRSMVAMDFRCLITSQRDTPDLEQVSVKAACGAIEYLKIIQVSNIRQVLVELKKRDYRCIGLDQDGRNHTTSKSDRVAIVVGSEGYGLQSIVRKECDEILTLKTAKDFNVLNASVAAAIAMYQINNSIGCHL